MPRIRIAVSIAAVMCMTPALALGNDADCWDEQLGFPYLAPSFLSGSTDDADTDGPPIPGEGEILMGIANPATIYAEEMGYKWRVERTSDGEYGIITFPDGTECEEWDFYRGQCGREWSYCARHGWETETAADGEDPFSPVYSICVGGAGRSVGPVSELMNLRELASRDAAIVRLDRVADESGDQRRQSDVRPLRRIRDLPSSFDWRDVDGVDWMTPVRNQGGCGSCWAFSAVGAVEAMHNIYWDDPDLDHDLSEQMLVSDDGECCDECGNCGGGWPSTALGYMYCGIVDETCFPYTAHGSTPCSDKCTDWQDRLVYIDGKDTDIPSDADSLKVAIVREGPLSVCIFGDAYWDGDIMRCDGSARISHAIVATGYDDAGGYWICKNSWGSGWHGDGYFKVGYGECRIEGSAALPLFENKPFPQPMSQGTLMSVYVDCSAMGYEDGSQEFPFSTIQQAVLEADSSAVVHLAAGVYTGEGNRDVLVPRRNLKLIGAGADETIMDCEGQTRGMVFGAGYGLFYDSEQYHIPCYYDEPLPDTTMVLRGLTIRNADGTALEVYGSPIIRDCTFTGNSGSNGGGMKCVGGAPTIENCTFADNWASDQGAGILSDKASPEISACVFSGNGTSSALGSGFYAYSGSPTLSGCTFVGNTRGQIALGGSDTGGLIENCIVAFSSTGRGIDCYNAEPETEITGCCVFGNASSDSIGSGPTCGNYHDNLFVDPLFCDAQSGDYTLHNGSPCLPECNDWGVLIGAMDEGCGSWTDVASGTELADEGKGRAASWADYDMDGNLDLFHSTIHENKLYRNMGSGVFVDVAGTIGLGGNTNSRGSVWADCDNDGDLDLFVGNAEGANQLYESNEGQSFVDIAPGTLLADVGAAQCVSWCDYDSDGLVDLFVGNAYTSEKLYHNEGDMVFSDSTSQLPLAELGKVLGASWADYDNDGDMDIYVTSYDSDNRLFKNIGQGGFTDATDEALVGDSTPSSSCAWGDYDSDGHLDLYVVNDGANRLFHNNGDLTFDDVTDEKQLGDSTYGLDAAWIDYDNDGDLDLYVCVADGMPTGNVHYINEGDETFTRIACGTLADHGDGRSCSFGDYDADGDLDMYLTNNLDPNRLFENLTPTGNHWLHVELEGVFSNRSAIGARVEALAGGVRQIREVSGGAGSYSQCSLPVEFGLGTCDVVDSLVIRWPSGIVNRFADVTVDRMMWIQENPTPATPEQLVVSGGVAEGSMDLSWSPVDDSNLSHYVVERDTSDLFGSETVVVTHTDTLYTDADLALRDEYWYRVAAVDSGEQMSGYSETLSQYPTDLPPATPSGVAATLTENGEGVFLSWAAVSAPDFDHYSVERDTNGLFSANVVTWTTQDTVWTDAPLELGVEYFYRLFAVDPGGLTSDPSDTVSATPQDLPPAAPRDLAAVAEERAVALSWSSVSDPDLDYYRIERDTTVLFGSGTSVRTTTATHYLDSPLAVGIEYFYRTFAVDTLGSWSAPSDTVSAIPFDMPPPRPEGLAAVGLEAAVALTWNSVSATDLDFYRVERDTSDAFGAGSVFHETGDTAYVDSPLSAGVEYFYRVAAVDTAGGSSTPSDTVSANPLADVSPAPPASLAGAAEERAAVLSWNAVSASDLDHYRVERDTSSAFGSGTASGTTSDTTYVDSPLSAGEEYFYRVLAVDQASNESAPSDTVSVVPLADVAPSAPQDLIALGGSDQIELHWSENPELDLSGYLVVRDATPTFALQETLCTTEATTHIDTAGSIGEGLWYRVMAEDAAGHLSTPSYEVAGVKAPGTGIYVDASNSGWEDGTLESPYKSIQSGLNDASSGDVVVVFPGEYGSNVTLTDGVSLVGMRGADEITINATVSATGIDAPVTLKGFKVDCLNALTKGLDCSGSGLTIEDCEFVNATSAGVSFQQGGAPVVRRCSFTGNQTGVSCSDTSAPHITSSTFSGNAFANVSSFGTVGPVLGGGLAEANDFLDYGTLMVFNAGADPLPAEYNYWGDDCVDPAWFTGLIDYTPWTDVTHTLEFAECWTDIDEPAAPEVAYASRAFPNPAGKGTRIAFGLPDPGGRVTLRVYSAAGKLVRTLVDAPMPGGHYTAEWNGRDERGNDVSAGVYFYALEAPDLESRGKMVILK